MDLIFNLAIGLGLAAACGFRVFVPMLIMSIAVQSGNLTLAPEFAWIGTTPALAVFAIAAGIEVLGYYIPWVDNLLDSVATPTAIVAGVIVTYASAPEMSPVLQWSLAVILGGGAAGTVQVGTSLLRAGSTATTGGLGNPVVSTGELFGSAALSILAVVVPLVAMVLAAIVVLFMLSRIGKRVISPKV